MSPLFHGPGRTLLPGLLFVLLGLAGVARAGAGGDLAQDPYWHTLLHYRAAGAGVVSLVDDPRFFLAPGGKSDPRAELAATLAAFAQPEPAGDAHPQCRFPARRAWLAEQFGAAAFPEVACPELEATLAGIAPSGATLIFPGTYSNSPASMFGHTLIAIEGPYASRLVSHALNYAARTDETNGFAYAVKGIFGFYKGYYSLLPYYVKVREYNDLERRDVWEYPLALERAEVERLVLHAWELRDIWSDYYFFDENCSYNLLFLLDAARPGLALARRTRPWVIPIDTVRVMDESGLLGEAAYRPSKANRIAHLAGRMDREEKRLAQALLAAPGQAAEIVAAAPATREGTIRALDVAGEVLEFAYFTQEMPQEVYRDQSLALLRARSRLGAGDPADRAVPIPERPERGHGSNRFAFLEGVRRDDPFVGFRLRPAYHNLLDADAGYLPGSQIDFLNVEGRVYLRSEQLALQRLDLVHIVSLAPRHTFFKPVSWKIDTGLMQQPLADERDHLVYRLSPGGGFAWGRPGRLAYLLFETDLQAGGVFRDSYRLGFGGSGGLLVNADPWKLHLRGRGVRTVSGDEEQTDLAVQLEQNFAVARNAGVSLQLTRERASGHWLTEGVLALNLYW